MTAPALVFSLRPNEYFYKPLLRAISLAVVCLLGGCQLVRANPNSSVANHLNSGQEYYFAENPIHGYFLSQTYTTKPLSAASAEAENYIRIGTVRTDQKIDHETTFLRKRAPFPIDPAKFKSLADGTHFFFRGSSFTLEPIAIDRAIHSEEYIKLTKQGDQVSAEQVSTPTMSFTRYTYFANGHFKKMTGYKRDGSEKTNSDLDFDEKTGQPIVPGTK